MSDERRFQQRLGDPRLAGAPTTSYRHRVNYHPLKSWWGDKRVDRRRLLATGGMASVGIIGLAIVGCGDDDEKEAAPAAAETPAAETPAEEAPAAEVPAEEAPAAPAPAEEAPAEAAPEDLIVAQAAMPVTFETNFGVEHETQEGYQTMASNLVRQRYIPDAFGSGYDRQDISGAAETFEPELSTEWSVSDDGLTYTFKLRDGLSSFAGNPFTAEDVLYTWQRNFDIPGINAFLGVFAMAMEDLDPNRWQAPDENTITATLQYPNETFMHNLGTVAHAQVIDSALVKSKATEEDPWGIDFTSNNSSGFGAFGLTSFEQGKEAIWEPNPGYHWFQQNGMPQFKRMIWRSIPESATRLSLVQRGDVHIAKQMLVREQEEAEKDEGIQVPNMKTNFIVFGPLNIGTVPFDDKRVRQAFLYTIPYTEIINTVYKGRAERAFGVVWDLIPGYDGSAYERYVLDIDKAKALLAEAGLPDGFEFQFGYSLVTPDMEEAAILMRDSAAQAGIQMNLKGLTPSEMNDEHNSSGTGNPHIVRDFAVVQTVPYNLRLFATPNTPIDWAGWGTQGSSEWQEFAAAIQRGQAAGDDDSPEALAAWSEAQAIYAEESPYFWAVHVAPAVIMRSNISGFAWRTQATMDYHRLRFT